MLKYKPLCRAQRQHQSRELAGLEEIRDGQCIRLVTQDQWNRMPIRDPIQPRLIDHTQLYLRLSLPDVADLRDTLLQKMSMTKPMKQRAMQKLMLLGMYKQDGTITALGKFAAELGCEPENAVLLWYANEFQVMEDALTIFAILARGPNFTSKEQRIKVPHPDGDMHSLVNVWHYFQWLDQRTNSLTKEEKERESGPRNICPLGITRQYLSLERKPLTVARISLAIGQLKEMRHIHLVWH